MKLLKWLGVISVVAVSLCVTVFAVSYFQKPKDCPVCHNKGVIYEKCPKCRGYGQIWKMCPSCGGKGWLTSVMTIISRGNYSGNAQEAIELWNYYESQRLSGSLTQEGAIQRGEYQVHTQTCWECKGKGWVVESCPLCHGKGYLIRSCPKCSKDKEVEFINPPEPSQVHIHQTFNITVGGKKK